MMFGFFRKPTCPTSLKVKYKTWDEASRASLKYEGQHPYDCRCGNVHLTTMSMSDYRKDYTGHQKKILRRLYRSWI